MERTKRPRFILPVGRLTVELHPDGDEVSDALEDWTFELETPALKDRVVIEHVETSDGLLSFTILLDATNLPLDAVSTPDATPRPHAPAPELPRSGLTSYTIQVRQTFVFHDTIEVEAEAEEEARRLAIEEFQCEWSNSEELGEPQTSLITVEEP